jgi:hypothetical protein
LAAKQPASDAAGALRRAAQDRSAGVNNRAASSGVRPSADSSLAICTMSTPMPAITVSACHRVS